MKLYFLDHLCDALEKYRRIKVLDATPLKNFNVFLKRAYDIIDMEGGVECERQHIH